MTYRKLNKDEWPRLAATYEAMGWTLPDQNLAAVFIAENEAGEICGQLVMEFELVAKDLNIRPDSIGKVSFRGLAAEMAKEVFRIKDQLPDNAGVYFLSEMENVEKFGDLFGFEPMKARCWRMNL